MPSAKLLSKAQYETLASLRFALRMFLGFSEDAATATGITPPAFSAIFFHTISPKPGTTGSACQVD